MSLLSFRPGRVGGAETYVRALIARLPEVAPGDELSLVMDRDVARDLEAPGWKRVVAPLGARALMVERILEAYTPWRARRLEDLIAGLRSDVLFFPQQSIFPLEVPGSAVLTVGDVQHVFHPESFGLFDRTFRPRIYPRSLARARHVIAVSEFTRKALIERCGVPADKVTTVAHGVAKLDSAQMAPRESTTLVEGRYLYYPAATYAHKGHAPLLRSYAALRKRGDISEKLVFTGERTRLWKRRLVPLARALGVEQDVLHLGFVPHAELERLYIGASAIVFPTQYEGFGIPVLEAARYGKRIITSRLEVFDEIGVPGRFQIDFDDPRALHAALREPGTTVLEKSFITWLECAKRTLAILRRAALPCEASGMGPR